HPAGSRQRRSVLRSRPRIETTGRFRRGGGGAANRDAPGCSASGSALYPGRGVVADRARRRSGGAVPGGAGAPARIRRGALHARHDTQTAGRSRSGAGGVPRDDPDQPGLGRGLHQPRAGVAGEARRRRRRRVCGGRALEQEKGGRAGGDLCRECRHGPAEAARPARRHRAVPRGGPARRRQRPGASAAGPCVAAQRCAGRIADRTAGGAAARPQSEIASPSTMTGRTGVLVVTTAVAAIAARGTGTASQAGAHPTLTFSFTNVARTAGLDGITVFGGANSNKYVLETTGTGVAAIDYDRDGWLDLFFVNGSTLEGFPSGQAPVNRLYRNRGDGTFEDVTAKAGVGASGWGQGACAGDYDNDGYDDLFVSYFGQNHLYHNRGNGTFEDVTGRAG